jgi:hypothetical protein
VPEVATLREVLEACRQTFCGTIGAEFMYLSDVGQKRWLQAKLEPIRATPAYTAGGQEALPGATDPGRDPGALPAHQVCRPEALLARGRRSPDPGHGPVDPHRRHGRRAGNGDRHGPPRPPQRAGQYAGQAALDAVRRVRGQEEVGSFRRRRQVPHGLLVRCRHAGRPGAPDAGLQSVPPRNRQSRGGRLGLCAPGAARRRRARSRRCRC